MEATRKRMTEPPLKGQSPKPQKSRVANLVAEAHTTTTVVVASDGGRLPA